MDARDAREGAAATNSLRRGDQRENPLIQNDALGRRLCSFTREIEKAGICESRCFTRDLYALSLVRAHNNLLAVDGVHHRDRTRSAT
jgi:hypothetical protein